MNTADELHLLATGFAVIATIMCIAISEISVWNTVG